MVPRSGLLLLLASSVVLGQAFSALVPNRDGSVVYFSSAARMKGTSQYLHPKIFQWDSVNGIALLEQRPSDLPYPRPWSLWEGRSYYSLVSSDVSSDGSLVAVTGQTDCYGTSYCGFGVERSGTTVYARSSSARPPVTAAGLGTLSPNGRYLLLTPSSWVQFPNATLSMTVLDLFSGETAAYKSQGISRLPGSRHRVSNDGSVVVRTADGLSIANGAQSKLIPNSALAQRAMIDDAAKLVVFETPTSLSAYSTATRATVDLATAPYGTAFGASMSDDGALIAFLAGADRQVYLIGADGKGMRQLTSLGRAVVEAALSGDGKTLFAVTADGAVLRIDATTGVSREIVPPTPYLLAPQGIQARGALAKISGAGFATQPRQAAPPYPLTLDGVEVRVGGGAAPLASIAPDSISFALPWDLPDAPFDVEVRVSGAAASPFVPGFEAAPAFPGFALLSAIHEDFASLVTRDHPAKAGEIVHLYARNLGPVSPPPAPGLPVPLQPLSTLTTTLACFFGSPPGLPVEVVFAGLAPTMFDVFQVDVRVPALAAGAGADLIGCQLGDPAARNYIPGFWPSIWIAEGSYNTAGGPNEPGRGNGNAVARVGIAVGRGGAGMGTDSSETQSRRLRLR